MTKSRMYPRRPAGRRLWPMLLLLAGCGGGDDYARPGTWSATGVNDANLLPMLANPADARRGSGAVTERAQPASLAIRRLQRDRRRPLPEVRASTVGISGAPAPLASPESDNAP